MLIVPVLIEVRVTGMPTVTDVTVRVGTGTGAAAATPIGVVVEGFSRSC